MTWLQALLKHNAVSSIFLLLEGGGSQNDNMHEELARLTPDPRGSQNDLFNRQQPLTREMLIAILQARIQRRLS